MKIDLSQIDLTQFMAHQHMVAGDVVTLVQPQHIGTKWTQSNKHLRSSVWNSDGELISAGFPKFVNIGENPEHFPVPQSLKNATVVEKLDGSLLIVSKYKGEYILRTRGTVDASTLANGHELDVFRSDILPLLETNLFDHVEYLDTWNVSYLFEWTSTLNKIVINYGDSPSFQLIGAVSHDHYGLWKQSTLDFMALKLGLKRPATFKFESVTELITAVTGWVGQEGVVVYTNWDQDLHKAKSDWYKKLHHLKSELSNVEKVLDVWLNQGMPDYNTFYEFISVTFDYELAESCRGHISNICDAAKEINRIVEAMKEFLKTRVVSLPNRREQAKVIIDSYGPTSRASFMFSMLDGKELDTEQYKKLAFQCLKK